MHLKYNDIPPQLRFVIGGPSSIHIDLTWLTVPKSAVSQINEIINCIYGDVADQFYMEALDQNTLYRLNHEIAMIDAKRRMFREPSAIELLLQVVQNNTVY